jgi:hypothetical protein
MDNILFPYNQPDNNSINIPGLPEPRRCDFPNRPPIILNIHNLDELLKYIEKNGCPCFNCKHSSWVNDVTSIYGLILLRTHHIGVSDMCILSESFKNIHQSEKYLEENVDDEYNSRIMELIIDCKKNIEHITNKIKYKIFKERYNIVSFFNNIEDCMIEHPLHSYLKKTFIVNEICTFIMPYDDNIDYALEINKEYEEKYSFFLPIHKIN